MSASSETVRYLTLNSSGESSYRSAIGFCNGGSIDFLMADTSGETGSTASSSSFRIWKYDQNITGDPTLVASLDNTTGTFSQTSTRDAKDVIQENI